MKVIEILMLVLFIYLGIQVLYIFVFSIIGKFSKPLSVSPTGIFRKYAVLIPAYKEDAVILNSASQALNQTYTKDGYDVVVIADSLKPETIALLKKMPIKLVEVNFDKSTKSKSLRQALEVLPEIYDYALILDADNIMEEDFIEKVNMVFVRTGAKALQAHRVAKNVNTDFAILDAISEEINNHIFRRAHRTVGLSSALIGSGMVFDFLMFKELMENVDAIGGFDREIGLKLAKAGLVVEYVEDAIVYDEKVENAEVFQNQRRRWMSAQFHYLRTYFFDGLWNLITRKNIDFFDIVFQQLLLPRVLVISATIFCATIACVMQFGFQMFLGPGADLWMILVFMNASGMLLAIPDNLFNKSTLSAAMSLPKAAMLMFLTLFKLKGANKKFIHTPHSGTMDSSIKSDDQIKKTT